MWTPHILAANNGILDWKYGSLEDEKLRDEQSRVRLQPDPNSFPSDFNDSKENTQAEVGNDRIASGQPSQETVGSIVARTLGDLDMLASFGAGSQSSKVGKRKAESDASGDDALRRRQ